MKAKELSELEKPYYGSGQHEETYETFQDFFIAMIHYDVDLNLCYRFDISEKDEGGYRCALFTILQRKGRVTEHTVNNFKDSDYKLLKKYMEPHLEVLKKLVAPF